MKQDDSHRERRAFSRIPFSGNVTVLQDQARWITKLVDISMKGVLVSRPMEWLDRPSDTYRLEISLDDYSRVIIAMEASLIHTKNNCLGFCCNHIDLESMSHLRRLLELNIGDETRINSELSALVNMQS